MRAKFCENCGAKLADTDRFCPECGTKQPQQQPAPPADPAVDVVRVQNDDMLGGVAGYVVYEETNPSAPAVEPEAQPKQVAPLSKAELVQVMNTALKYLGQKQYDQALSYVLGFFDRGEKNLEYLCLLARCYRMAGCGSTALAYYMQCFQLDPEYAIAYANAAMVYMDRQEYKQAEKMCVYAIMRYQKDPARYEKSNYAVMYASYTRAVALQGRKADAERLLKEAEKLGYPRCGELRRELGLR